MSAYRPKYCSKAYGPCRPTTFSVMFQTEIWVEMHSDFNVSAAAILYIITKNSNVIDTKDECNLFTFYKTYMYC